MNIIRRERSYETCREYVDTINSPRSVNELIRTAGKRAAKKRLVPTDLTAVVFVAVVHWWISMMVAVVAIVATVTPSISVRTDMP